MPKLYEYFGIVVYFYTNEHEPIHGKHAGRESKAEIIREAGQVVDVVFSDVAGKRPLEGPKLRDFQELVEAKAEEIVERWIDFFVHNIRSKPETITRRLK